MLRCGMTVWDGGGAAPRTGEVDLDRVAEAVADPTGLVWIDLLAPTHEELRALGERLHLGPMEIEDAIAPRERPKAAQHPGRISFVTYALTPRDDVAEAIRRGEDERREEDRRELASARGATGPPVPAATGTGGREDGADDRIDRVLEGEGASGAFGDTLFAHTRVSGFLLEHALVTVRSNADFDVAAVRERWEDLGDVHELGVEGLVHGLLDVIVDQYFDAVQFLDDRIEDLEDDLFAEESRRLEGFQRRAYALRKELVSLRRVVLPMRDVLGVMRRDRAAGQEGPQVRLDALYADLMDHVLRVSEWTESLRDMIATVFETHLSLQDQRLNEVTKRLAGWAAVISVPTLVTGWFGMNVPYPGHDAPSGLVAAVLATVVPAIGLWALMRRLRWL